MGAGQIVDMAHRAMYMALLLGVPLLGICLVVGLVISIFETVTQIHEQALAFVPKLIAVILLLVFIGGWMTRQLESFTREVFKLIGSL